MSGRRWALTLWLLGVYLPCLLGYVLTGQPTWFAFWVGTAAVLAAALMHRLWHPSHHRSTSPLHQPRTFVPGLFWWRDTGVECTEVPVLVGKLLIVEVSKFPARKALRR